MAPNAERVSVVGDFNDWDPRRHPMRGRADIGVWEIFLPGVGLGRAYKYHITGPDGVVQPLKASDIARVAPLTNIDDLRIEPSSKAYVLHGEGVDEEREAQVEEDTDDSTAGVRLSGKADVAGERIEIFAFAMIELEGTTIRITPHRLRTTTMAAAATVAAAAAISDRGLRFSPLPPCGGARSRASRERRGV